MKQVNLTLETAKEMYNSNSASLKKFALDNYTEQELTKKGFPKVFLPHYTLWYNEEIKTSAIALGKLITMRNLWWEVDNNWKPNYKDSSIPKYIITTIRNKSDMATYYNGCNTILAFRTKEIRDEFFETFKDLIEIAKPLL